MPSRRHIREAVVQFLYCADLEGGANPAELRGPFWDFVTESDRRSLQLATFRTVHHLAHGREGRLVEFVERQSVASALLSAYPQAEVLKLELKRVAEMESGWSTLFAKLERLPKDDDDASVAESFSDALEKLFKLDRDLALARLRFLQGIEDFPALRGQLEAVAATIRRLQRISDRLRMVEEPEKFPEQADLARLRDSKEEIIALRKMSDELVDSILVKKESIDETLAAVVENFSPERIDPVDRAILRLGTYEILHAAIPPKVAINEAIELAKRFGTTDSRRFVNGVLDKISKHTAGSSENQEVL
ncbi:transcription antitermination factor NusB [Luteolibacter yonseiensis]|uniref:Transcription antitermination protein NusB n=1 Tax=Luteolibacter yonseiensis TaxID=1144680 RepID=A0A934VDG9_9BACT|nr:transcription antitermination factor NusB [Luteolibacter yonseiensis]MBK1817554.1 transcription antitermination factor NusB [Luteolibacter yonseiensis]